MKPYKDQANSEVAHQKWMHYMRAKFPSEEIRGRLFSIDFRFNTIDNENEGPEIYVELKVPGDDGAMMTPRTENHKLEMDYDFFMTFAQAFLCKNQEMFVNKSFEDGIGQIEKFLEANLEKSFQIFSIKFMFHPEGMTVRTRYTISPKMFKKRKAKASRIELASSEISVKCFQ